VKKVDAKTSKKLMRQEVWNRLEAEGFAKFPLPCFSRIPNFVGSEKAAERLRLSKEWKTAKVVFVNPDFAQQKVREHVLLDGKTLVMATPKLRQGYIIVEPEKVKDLEKHASTIKGAFQLGKTAEPPEIPRPDLIVEGSVAVDKQGNRLGKGCGYGDREIKTLKKAFGPTPVVTTVHDAQVVNNVPTKEKDEKVSIILTPSRIIRTSKKTN
jgi:5-formyltetrahydrofolate cyclo-ligase